MRTGNRAVLDGCTIRYRENKCGYVVGYDAEHVDDKNGDLTPILGACGNWFTVDEALAYMENVLDDCSNARDQLEEERKNGEKPQLWLIEDSLPDLQTCMLEQLVAEGILRGTQEIIEVWKNGNLVKWIPVTQAA